ncbi:uncharacterized protein LOC142981495 [Anticarsia gemmatalis]|uniref:uncharacterized protein LOC142981495 n=1 Tax=Anticarsia gemmatalis TaxID=129554 RepID=UPI003F762E79
MHVSIVAAVFIIIYTPRSSCDLRDFNICQEDFNLNPGDGVLKELTFPWLGFVQYIHVTTGLAHQSKAPRVVLVQQQFVIGTATDLLNLPKNYKLGNVIFGEYDRDEEDCGLSRPEIKLGHKCPRAYIEMPILVISPHPEYSRFGVGNSIALVKLLRPMKSHYMIPLCLPSLEERVKKRKFKVVYLIDYISSVPRDFNSERMGKKTLKLYTHKDCRRHRMRSKLGSEGVTHVLCTSGCGVRPGAPIITHSADGRFELIGLAAGGAPCTRRSMRRRLNAEPPLYIDVFPYNTWLMNLITAHKVPKPYPQQFQLVQGGGGVMRPRTARNRKQKSGWKSRLFVMGNLCFKPKRKIRQRSSFFYAEQFEVHADPPAKLHVVLQVSAGYECSITCVRIMLPNRLSMPIITGVGGYNITIKFNTEWFPYVFFFTLGLNGSNATMADRRVFYWERQAHRDLWGWSP